MDKPLIKSIRSQLGKDRRLGGTVEKMVGNTDYRTRIFTVRMELDGQVVVTIGY